MSDPHTEIEAGLEDPRSVSLTQSNTLDTGPGWKLTVTVTIKNGDIMSPRNPVRIQLDRHGTKLGRRKSASEDLSADVDLSDGTPTSHSFIGSKKKRYKCRAVLDQEDWFYWESSECDITLKNLDDKEIEIEIKPNLVLVEMAGVSDIKSRFTNGVGCQDDYLMTKTATAANLQSKLGGSSKLQEGSVNAPAIIAKAAKLEALLGFKKPPYFSVVDINKAHQMSFFLSCLAFRQHGKANNQKLVINFDNHRDYAGGSQDVSFDKWGMGFFHNAEALKGLWGDSRVVYTIIGETQVAWTTSPQKGSLKQLYFSNQRPDGTPISPDTPLGTVSLAGDANVWITGDKNLGTKLWDIRLDGLSVVNGKGYAYHSDDIHELEQSGILIESATTGNNKKLWELTTGELAADGLRDLNREILPALQQHRDRFVSFDSCNGAGFLNPAHVGNLATTDVYVTVDRDVSIGSFTYWNDGYVTAEAMRDSVKRCLEHLKSQGANLVGFDVAGLPDSLGRSVALGLNQVQGTGADPGEQEADIINQAREDINFFLQEVIAYGPT